MITSALHTHMILVDKIFFELEFGYEKSIVCCLLCYSHLQLKVVLIKFVFNRRRKLLSVRKYRSYHQNLSDDSWTS